MARVPAPHEVGGEPVEYRVVIPTRGRWRAVKHISPFRTDQDDLRPFILARTLALLQQQLIPASRVTLWTADEDELAHYKEALRNSCYWRDTEVRVGVPGIMNQRNHIVQSYPEGAYLVSIDDDVADVRWKDAAGSTKLITLPSGSLENIFRHAHKKMTQLKCFIWGLSTTIGNPLVMSLDGISTRNGEINGFFYGVRIRHDADLQVRIANAAEDAERSLRYFNKDKIIMRYRMYTCDTKPFEFKEGLQAMFEGINLADKNEARKLEERQAADKLHEVFPKLTNPRKEKKGRATLEVQFRHVGGFLAPVTCFDNLKRANELDQAAFKERSRRAALRRAAASGATAAPARAGPGPTAGDGGAAPEEQPPASGAAVAPAVAAPARAGPGAVRRLAGDAGGSSEEASDGEVSRQLRRSQLIRGREEDAEGEDGAENEDFILALQQWHGTNGPAAAAPSSSSSSSAAAPGAPLRQGRDHGAAASRAASAAGPPLLPLLEGALAASEAASEAAEVAFIRQSAEEAWEARVVRYNGPHTDGISAMDLALRESEALERQRKRQRLDEQRALDEALKMSIYLRRPEEGTAGHVGEDVIPVEDSQEGTQEEDARRLQEELGFSRMQVLEAFQRCSTAEAAVDWILSQEWNST